MPDASPLKWHLAHTTWFFETFVLCPYARHYSPHHPDFAFLFNSYYNGVGQRHERAKRGALTRPTVREVLGYRAAVDEAVEALLGEEAGAERPEILRIIEIGLHHEQQHQELVLTDLKHLFAQNVMAPRYREPLETKPAERADVEAIRWIAESGGLHEIGHADEGFAFDNERPRHRVYHEPFALADRLITNGEFLEFIDDGGYQASALWLDAGWSRVQREGWQHPFYWRRDDDGWSEFTLAGQRPLALDEPVSHVSFVEADAFARWAGARLPLESEWEVVASRAPIEGNFVESRRFHPDAAGPGSSVAALPRQLFGDLWEWTASSYGPYPGFKPEAGTLGEYNGKFMCDQMVLRGGSCATPRSHIRSTYRNFFYPPDRWQFSGIRLAKET
jgi:ergothioneine biosynthesis protein EgtB